MRSRTRYITPEPDNFGSQILVAFKGSNSPQPMTTIGRAAGKPKHTKIAQASADVSLKGEGWGFFHRH